MDRTNPLTRPWHTGISDESTQLFIPSLQHAQDSAPPMHIITSIAPLRDSSLLARDRNQTGRGPDVASLPHSKTTRSYHLRLNEFQSHDYLLTEDQPLLWPRLNSYFDDHDFDSGSEGLVGWDWEDNMADDVDEVSPTTSLFGVGQRTSTSPSKMVMEIMNAEIGRAHV